MQKQTDNAEPDREALLLSKVYALILSFDTPEPEPTRADAADAPKPRKAKARKREEPLNDE